MSELVEILGRLERQVPREQLSWILRRLAERLEELETTNQGAELELRVRVVRGRYRESRWDGDERSP